MLMIFPIWRGPGPKKEGNSPDKYKNKETIKKSELSFFVLTAQL